MTFVTIMLTNNKTIAGILLIGPLGTKCSEMLVEIRTFSFKKIFLKMLSVKWRPFCLGFNVLKQLRYSRKCDKNVCSSRQNKTFVNGTIPWWETPVVDSFISWTQMHFDNFSKLTRYWYIYIYITLANVFYNYTRDGSSIYQLSECPINTLIFRARPRAWFARQTVNLNISPTSPGQFARNISWFKRW